MKAVLVTLAIIVGLFLCAAVLYRVDNNVHRYTPPNVPDERSECVRSGTCDKQQGADACSQTNPLSRCYDKPKIEQVPQPEFIEPAEPK